MHRSSLVPIALFSLSIAGCAARSPDTPELVAASVPRLPVAVAADSQFWRIFHAGSYDSIPQAMFLLKAAYAQNPGDPQTAAHIGFLHAWKITERSRAERVPPTIIDEAILARTFFAQAQRNAPAPDARFHGFGAAFQMIEANIHRDTAQWSRGLQDGRRAITAWPEFNWFTVGYTLSGKPDTSALFAEAVDMQWKTVDACARATIDRRNPVPSAVLGPLSTESNALRRRACSNSWIAPHNVQGFFLNMGDMIVKAGDPFLARRVYALAKEADGYAKWPYAPMLEERIRDADANVAGFRAGRVPMMVASKAACVACHQGVTR